MNKKQPYVGRAKETRAGAAALPVVQGFKYVRLAGALLQALHEAGTKRDRAGNRPSTGVERAEIQQSNTEMRAYFQHAIARRRTEPRDDLLTALVRTV